MAAEIAEITDRNQDELSEIRAQLDRIERNLMTMLTAFVKGGRRGAMAAAEGITNGR